MSGGGSEPAALRTPDALRAAFRDHFGREPTSLQRAPGRVNLLGEHTDYNEGFVLPLALDRDVRVALAPRDDGRVRVASHDLDEETEFALAAPEARSGWAAYVHGVAWSLAEAGLALRGFDAVVSGTVPRGAGLSSSAALELAMARAFHAASGFAWEPTAMARAAQRVENDWLGLRSGIMDQLASAHGRAGHALRIDCRDLEVTPVPLPPGATVWVLDTDTRRGLTDSAYNERRAQCEAAARALGVPFLRDADLDTLEAAAGAMTPTAQRRARHVISENARTLEAAEALRDGDARAVGALMNAGHASLRDDFEVSSAELDAMVEAARAEPTCFGARMTGAGFGGCAVALMEVEAGEEVGGRIGARYREACGREATVYRCSGVEGAGVVR